MGQLPSKPRVGLLCALDSYCVPRLLLSFRVAAAITIATKVAEAVIKVEAIKEAHPATKAAVAAAAIPVRTTAVQQARRVCVCAVCPSSRPKVTWPNSSVKSLRTRLASIATVAVGKRSSNSPQRMICNQPCRRIKPL